MGQDGENRQGVPVDPQVATGSVSDFVNPQLSSANSELEVPERSGNPDSNFERLLADDRSYEKSVSRRMVVTWLSVVVLIAAWWVVATLFGTS